MTFFVAGYAVVWALVFLYIWFIHRKQSKLEQEVTLLEELVQKRRPG